MGNMKPIWRGVLSFGLIHLPVNLYTGTKQKDLSFRLLHEKDLSPIRYARICTKERKEIPWEEIVKGYELESGDFVVLTEEDFEKANVKMAKSIEILDFCKKEEIPTSYFQKPYLLEPQKGSARAYALLREALERSKKVGVCTFVMRTKEHLGAITAEKDFLVLNQLRFRHELIQNPSLNIPKKGKVAKREMEMALELIDHLSAPFKPKRYKDEYHDELLGIIEKKSKGKKVRKKGKVPKKTKEEDFLKLLKKSIKKKAA